MLFLLLLCPAVFAESFPVEFIKLKDGVWLHRSYAMLGGYKTPSNGLILETAGSAVLIDTAWDNEETGQIIRFIKTTIKKPLVACIITHSHDDRAGGLAAVTEGNATIYMTSQTFELLGRPDFAKRYQAVLNDRILVDGLALQVDYFGPAHASDNITVWVGEKKLLFGGCLIKPLDAKNLGNTADADLTNWPIAVRRIAEKYGDAKLVIPGHGNWGDASLISHTLRLFGPS
jgi:metallo-beta-lactamase class B